ncbi:MAG: hypothetical protein AAB403_20525 [Planctomycetota bacterium]
MSGEAVDAGERATIEASGLFDVDFYARTYRDSIPADMPPLDHYLAEGEARGLLASANFDPIVYKLRHLSRSDPRPLVDCARNGDRKNYRDLGALFADIEGEAFPVTFRAKPNLWAEASENANSIVAVIGRSARLNGPEFNCELQNPSAETIFSRLAGDRPFSFARLPHGFWDSLCANRKLAAQLQGDLRCIGLSRAEVENVALRLMARFQLPADNGTFIEDMFHAIEHDLLNRPADPDHWTAISVTGAPGFEDALYGLDPEDMGDRLRLLAGYFRPRDTLYDATMWKRWALSGDLAKLAEATRSHPVVLIGPQKFQSLGEKWRLGSFRHVTIGPRLVQLVRHSLLDRATDAIRAALAEPGAMKPVVLFQTGSIAYWLIHRLRACFPDVFYLDLGQALDLWYWTGAPWMRIYGDALRGANPFAAKIGGGDAETPPVTPDDGASRTVDEVSEILKRDYLDSGLMGLPPPTPHSRT